MYPHQCRFATVDAILGTATCSRGAVLYHSLSASRKSMSYGANDGASSIWTQLQMGNLGASDRLRVPVAWDQADT
jgi:hypothetical protein